jgi:hypothetical protein
MTSKLSIVVLLALLVLSMGTLAVAQTQITIGNSTSGAITFSGAGTSTIAFVGSCGFANCVSGYAYLGSSAGTYNMWITGNNPTFTATSDANLFAVNMNGGTLHFSFSLGSSSFAGTITLTTLKDGTLAPQFLGSLNVTSATGVFAGVYAPGQTLPFDMTIALPSGSALVDQVNAGLAASTSGSVSSGEIIPAPEPGTIALLGTGLLAVGGFLKRKLR